MRIGDDPSSRIGLASFALLAFLGAGCAWGGKPAVMSMKSEVFKDGGRIPRNYTCDGQNVNPPFSISGVPEKAESLAILVDDPDSQSGEWVHWILWNISPDVEEIPQESVPEGAVLGLTDFGSPFWNGPCPPSGAHRYRFRLFALDGKLDLPRFSRRAAFEEAIVGHVLAETTLSGTYRRVDR